MAAKKAVRFITVGETTYAPGDEVPTEVVALVDHPDAWVDPDAEVDEDDSKAASKRSK